MSTENTKDDAAPADENLYDQIKKDLKTDLSGELVETVTTEVKKAFARNEKNFAVPKEKDNTSFAEWLQNYSIVKHPSFDPDQKTKAFNILKEKYGQKAMVQGTAGSGGDTVPVNYANTIFDIEGFDSVFYPAGANIFSMASNVEKYPSWDFTVTPSGSGDSAFGAGMAVGYVAENNAPSADNPVTKQITFTADKAMALCEVSNELILNNIVGLETALQNKIRQETLSTIDYWAFNGNGQNCTGFIGHAATKNVARDTTDDVKLEDLANMYARMLPKRFSDYRWIVHPSVLPKLLQLSSGNGALVWLPNGIGSGLDMRIFGIPVVVSDNCGELGDEGDVCLVSRSGLGIGVNRNITIDVSPHYKFGYDLAVYRVVAQVAIKPMFVNKVLAKDGSYQLAYAVTLDDATS